MTVFKYKVSPSSGLFGADDGGFSIEILSDGTVMYKTYILSDQEKTRKVFLIDNVCMTEIKEVLKSYQAQIKEMPKKLDNGSLDGSQNTFVFNSKKITVWNISYQDEKEILEQDSGYYNEFKMNIKFENLILEIFNKLAGIFKNYGIKLDLDSIVISKNIKDINNY